MATAVERLAGKLEALAVGVGVTKLASTANSTLVVAGQNDAADHAARLFKFATVPLSLPSLLREFPSGHLDLLKIDIEGAEKEILENADSWMPSVKAVVIELHDRYKPGCSRAFYRATNHLPNEKHVGENIWVWSPR